MPLKKAHRTAPFEKLLEIFESIPPECGVIIEVKSGKHGKPKVTSIKSVKDLAGC
jgi:hypothetical protein